MNATPDYDRTVNIIRNALPKMSEYGIPITPQNLAVWFEYFNASNDDLRTEIDTLVGRGEAVTIAKTRELYDRYLSSDQDKLEQAQEVLRKIVEALLSNVNAADQQYTDYSKNLSEIATELAGDHTETSLGELMERAIIETSAVLQKGVGLRKQLSTLTEEVEVLRNELKHTHEAARTDALTGLCNRRALEEKFAEVVEGGLVDDHIPCILVADIDHFKKTNDSYGHLVGDLVLQGIAETLKENVRGKDLVARFGGEEFVILLRDTPRSGCLVVAEHLREAVEHLRIALPNGRALNEPVTTSLGGAWLRVGEEMQTLVERADKALYAAKTGGRNRVSWEGQPTSSPAEEN